MNTHILTSTRLLLPSLLALVPAALWQPAPAGAQQIPWIGLAAPGAQLLEEVGPGHHGPGPSDHFGFAVATGDFNNDGYDDLASGIPGNDCDFVDWDCGSVQVRFGFPVGTLQDGVRLDPAASGAPEPAAAFDEYGWALATGDFNNDGHDDLAVGVPGNDYLGTAWVDGAVHVHYGLEGSLGGIQPVAEHLLAQGVDGVPQEVPGDIHPLWEDRFGHALAVGDFNGDGHDDLAMGAHRAFLPGYEAGGDVVVAHGHIGGLKPFEGFLMRLGREGLPDTPETGEEFGYALAAGDFNGDGFDDLAIGVPREDDVGAVLVVYGSPFSLLFNNHWYFGHFHLGGAPQPGSRFGEALAVGDFDHDGYDDLAAGAPHYGDEGAPPVDFGLVSVVYGSQGGLTPDRVHWLYELVLYGPGTSETGDYFGTALAAGDFDGDGVDDLAIGADGENLEDTQHPNVGAVTVIPGRPLTGLTGAPRQLRPQRGSANNPAIVDPAGLIPDYRTGAAAYGQSLAVGDFDGNGFDDLAIGGPNRDVFSANLVDTGAVAVLYGLLFADGFEVGSTGAWSGATP